MVTLKTSKGKHTLTVDGKEIPVYCLRTAFSLAMLSKTCRDIAKRAAEWKQKNG